MEGEKKKRKEEKKTLVSSVIQMNSSRVNADQASPKSNHTLRGNISCISPCWHHGRALRLWAVIQVRVQRKRSNKNWRTQANSELEKYADKLVIKVKLLIYKLKIVCGHKTIYRHSGWCQCYYSKGLSAKTAQQRPMLSETQALSQPLLQRCLWGAVNSFIGWPQWWGKPRTSRPNYSPTA